ncbi:unnamed protein product [Nezara viridula]|uniref:Uncharacterized protein n=1 Tax=Nezara viridula TaxID=85310 RepID=A0A9P0ECQ5_NEZVI|nr:unnamed protein product [Nezara viridula]
MEEADNRQLVKHLSKSASELQGHHSLAHRTQSLFTSIKGPKYREANEDRDPPVLMINGVAETKGTISQSTPQLSPITQCSCQ